MSDTTARDQLADLIFETRDLSPNEIADAILARWALVAKPDAKSPTPALIEAAYIAQDDLSKPPEPWAIQAAAEVVDAYIDAQGHAQVHVLGHPKEAITDV